MRLVNDTANTNNQNPGVIERELISLPFRTNQLKLKFEVP